MSGLRTIAAPFVADPATGVCIRTRLKGLTVTDLSVLRSVGEHLGRLAASDLAERVADGLDHDNEAWADRKRDITAAATSRWAGAITKSTHDQWALARRAQAAHIGSLRNGVAMIEHRLSLPLCAKGTGGMPGGYRSRHEWFVKSRRLATLQQRLDRVEGDYAAGKISVVRGGKQLLHKRHHLGYKSLIYLLLACILPVWRW
ncbi:hypothetical protein [Mycolicibacterium cosmeticum]|uniref:hypothetical protein n=1 Tax=Mycolicibacterium cosmeticum TaxID=258533 RepID=UPI003204EAD5